MEEKSKNSVKSSVRPQNKHLKPFTKNDKRINRKGKDKGVLNYATLRELAIKQLAKLNNKTPLEIDVEIQANALLEARKGNFSFYKDDRDRTYGQAVAKIEVSTTDEAVKKAKQAIKEILNDSTGNN